MKLIYQAALMLLVTTLISGVIYPAIITGIGQLAFKNKSNGSLIRDGDNIIGSELIAQQFKKPEYFWPRPSASNFSALPSGASNLGPTSALLKQQITNRRQEISTAYGIGESEIPMDLLTASGSGLDPHISEEAARIQVHRIVNARHIGNDKKMQIEKLIDEHVEDRQFGIWGEKRVNVLKLNLALDHI
jgi:potassium-transporting ATPase KdpC subunit